MNTEALPILIGVDGGATAVKAHAVSCDSLARPTSFELLDVSAERDYPRDMSFAPVPVQEQLSQRDAAAEHVTPGEQKLGRAWVEAATDAIVAVATECGAGPLLVGVGMPGLKTADGRGIAVINNGPRIPDYLDRLEKALNVCGRTLVGPIARLGSDADYCGLGEEFATGGQFRDVENAYYIGGGTGIADAMKLGGRLVTFDEAAGWMAKSWQIHSGLGPTFEKFIAASTINAIYARVCCPGVEQVEAAFPEQASRDGEPVAGAWMATVALVLAELIADRLLTIKRGRSNVGYRGEAHARLDTSHPYLGTVLDRVIVGQRVGQILADERNAAFREQVDRCLAAMIAGAGDNEVSAKWLDANGDGIATGRLVASRLRAAPALGAAVAAVVAHADG